MVVVDRWSLFEGGRWLRFDCIDISRGCGLDLGECLQQNRGRDTKLVR